MMNKTPFFSHTLVYVFFSIFLFFSVSTQASPELDRLLEMEEVQDLYPVQHRVFGVPLIATKRTPKKAVQHALKVFKGYLDNDNDGKADNLEVIDALIKNHGGMVLGKNEDDWVDHFEELIGLIEENYDDVDVIEQSLFSLFANEVNPRNEFDASLEEILHLITHIGYGNAYPGVWGLEEGTPLAKAMDTARGGHYEDVPSRYPSRAWFTYEDDECDYACQMVEYTYWALTSYMGLQAGRGDDIGEEWKLASSQQFKTKDKAMLALITDANYKLPLRSPLD